MLLDQSNRQIALFSPFGNEKTDLALRAFTATEELGRLFRIDADLLSENAKLNFTDIVGKNVTIRLNTLQKGGTRFWNGHIRSFRQVGYVGRLARYQAIIVPQLWFLTRSADCRIFQNKNIPDIITKVLEPYNFPIPFENTLTADYQPWEYCVQYRETDLNFISRLMEQEGIHYYFRHENGKHTMILADLNSVHKDFPKYENIPFIPPHGEVVNVQSILEWTVSMEVQPSSYLLTDFDFKKPSDPLASRSAVLTPQVENGDHEIYDYPGEYTEHPDGDRYSMARIHELNTGFQLAYGESNARGLSSGCKFALSRFTRDEGNGDYLVISTVIKAEAESYFSSGGTPDTPPFSCSCTALKVGDVSFVPARLTPKPMIQGTQTAIVTGPKGEEIYTDEYGRIKVQFHWDREGKYDENTTLFIRVAEVWAGKRWGSTFTPRIGQEVVVAFLEGDPDQPLVIGSVYNAEQMPPYLGEGPDPKHKNDPKVSGIKSLSTKGGQGYNEWRFDDNKGKEEVFIHAERNMDTRVKNDSMHNVGHDYHLTVGGEKDGVKSGDQTEMVYRNKNLKIHKDHSEQIGGNMTLHVGGIDGDGNLDVHVDGKRTQVIKKDDSMHIVGNRLQKIDGNQGLKIGGNQAEQVGSNHALEAGQEIYLKAGLKIVIEAGTQISLKVGGNFIDISPAGVAISGTMLLLNSGGAAGVARPEPPSRSTTPTRQRLCRRPPRMTPSRGHFPTSSPTRRRPSLLRSHPRRQSRPLPARRSPSIRRQTASSVKITAWSCRITTTAQTATVRRHTSPPTFKIGRIVTARTCVKACRMARYPSVGQDTMSSCANPNAKPTRSASVAARTNSLRRPRPTNRQSEPPSSATTPNEPAAIAPNPLTPLASAPCRSVVNHRLHARPAEESYYDNRRSRQGTGLPSL